MVWMPRVLHEQETLKLALAGKSLARYGDGELRLCNGGDAVSQRDRDPKLVQELRHLLFHGQEDVLVCIPDFHDGPRAGNWRKYANGSYHHLYSRQQVYGSAFITRPDNAPRINTPEFWDMLCKLWRGRAVTLVAGALDKSLNANMLKQLGAVDCNVIECARTNAYAQIDMLEDKCLGTPSDQPLLLCAGATATVLAARLAKQGRWALDLGHVGMFMKRLGVV